VRRPLPKDVRAVLEAAELAAEQTAARLRLVALIAIGVLLAVLGALSGEYRRQIALMFALSLAVSVGSVMLARPGAFRRWVPWAMATLDAGVILGIIAFAESEAKFSGSYAPSLVVSWAVFVLLALAAIRLKPALVLYLGGLSIAGMAILGGLAPAGAASAPGHALDPALVRIFDREHNAVRLALIALTAGVLALSVERARRSLLVAVTPTRLSARLSRYFASGLLPLLAETDLAVLQRGRRQPAAILFADVRGFTARSEQLEPAAIAEFLSAFRMRARRAIERLGGIVDKFVGDDVMGVFGLPVTTANDAGNALAAGRCSAKSMTGT
jgi:adenylate cyclase